MLIAEVIARIEDQVVGLAGRTEGAAQFADLMARKALPQVTPAAHVLPLGLQGGQVQAAAGLFVQSIEEVIAVVLTFRSHERTGSASLAPLDQVIHAVIDALAGWGPENAVGVFALRRGAVISMAAGTIVYQLEFSISDQLRIAT
jgi:hypothetical protein